MALGLLIARATLYSFWVSLALIAGETAFLRNRDDFVEHS
jgi:hypothetical protein